MAADIHHDLLHKVFVVVVKIRKRLSSMDGVHRHRQKDELFP